MTHSLKPAFETYLYSENLEGSKKAGSYLTALKHLQTMLRSEAYGFDDCIDLWSVHSVERIAELRERVLAEAKRGTDTPGQKKGSFRILRGTKKGVISYIAIYREWAQRIR